MNELKMKAKAGVTLVELLVVILIVTILSVSMLPLLKPFVVEAQYAAEAIPVIGNIRTKVGLYQYEKGNLPTVLGTSSFSTPVIETWGYTADNSSILDPTSLNNTSVPDAFLSGYRTLAASAPSTDVYAQTFTSAPDADKAFFGNGISIDNQELVGKRCKPAHFQYVVIANGSTYCYVLGCFGDKFGLPQGTGYAVCEVNVVATDASGKTSVYKRIGTWKRYKETSDDQLTFGTFTAASLNTAIDSKNCNYCPIPDATTYFANPTVSQGQLDVVQDMISWGWEF